MAPANWIRSPAETSCLVRNGARLSTESSIPRLAAVNHVNNATTTMSSLRTEIGLDGVKEDHRAVSPGTAVKGGISMNILRYVHKHAHTRIFRTLRTQ